MITRSELDLVCRPLKSELQRAGLVFDDVQFDEFEQTLRIVVDDGPQRRLPRSPQTDSGDGAIIDARVLWDLIRDLIRLGMNPAIQLRRRRQGQSQTPEVRDPTTRGFLEAFSASIYRALRRMEEHDCRGVDSRLSCGYARFASSEITEDFSTEHSATSGNTRGL